MTQLDTIEKQKEFLVLDLETSIRKLGKLGKSEERSEILYGVGGFFGFAHIQY